MKKKLLLFVVAMATILSSCSNDDSNDSVGLVTVVPNVTIDRTGFVFNSRVARPSYQADIIAYCESDKSERGNSGSIVYLDNNYPPQENEFWESCGSFSLDKSNNHTVTFLAVESFPYSTIKSWIKENGDFNTSILYSSSLYVAHLEDVSTDELNKDTVVLKPINSIISILLKDELPEGYSLKVKSYLASTYNVKTGGITKWDSENTLIDSQYESCSFNTIASDQNTIELCLVDSKGNESESVAVFGGDSLLPIKANNGYMVNVYVDKNKNITFKINEN